MWFQEQLWMGSTDWFELLRNPIIDNDKWFAHGMTQYATSCAKFFQLKPRLSSVVRHIAWLVNGQVVGCTHIVPSETLKPKDFHLSWRSHWMLVNL